MSSKLHQYSFQSEGNKDAPHSRQATTISSSPQVVIQGFIKQAWSQIHGADAKTLHEEK